MRRLIFLSLICLSAPVDAALAQSATQAITIVVETHQSLSSESSSIAMRGTIGDERMRGEAKYALMLSGEGKVTAAISRHSGVRVSAIATSENLVSIPLELESEAHSEIGASGPTFGRDMLIAYAASRKTKLTEKDSAGHAATVTLTLTN